MRLTNLYYLFTNTGIGLCFIFLVFGSCNSSKIAFLSSENTAIEIVESSDSSEGLKRHEASAVLVGDNMYLLGGRRIQEVDIFNLKTNQWSKGEAPPLEIHHFQGLAIGSDIYVIGAFTGKYPGETPIENILIYSTLTNKWKYSDKIPRARGAAGLSIYGDEIILSCGLLDGHRSGHVPWVDAYNVKNKTWRKLADAPHLRDHFQSAIVAGKLYHAGGRTSMAPNKTFSETVSSVDVLDLKANAWTTLADTIPTSRAGTMAIGWMQSIIVVGGESSKQDFAHNEIEALNTKTNKWTTLHPLIQGRHGTGLVLYQNSLYLGAGCAKRGGVPELNTIEKIRLIK